VTHPILFPLSLLAAIGLAISVAGAEPEARDATKDSAAPPVFSPAPPVADKVAVSAKKAEMKTRIISPEIAAALASEIPKYDPPKPPQAAKVDARKADAPKNQIHRLPAARLPTYVVQDSKYRELSAKEVYTDKVFTDMQVKHYLTEFDYGFLNRFTIPLFGMASKESRAMEMSEREEWKEANGELSGFAKLENADQPPPAKK
jgi:hypothetical protein